MNKVLQIINDLVSQITNLKIDNNRWLGRYTEMKQKANDLREELSLVRSERDYFELQASNALNVLEKTGNKKGKEYANFVGEEVYKRTGEFRRREGGHDDGD